MGPIKPRHTPCLCRTTTPPLTLPILPILLDQLNASRDIYAFVRHVRLAFRELAVQGR